MTVYVLLELQETGLWRPVAVTQDEDIAENFYQHDTKDRDWIPFQLDEVPMLTGVPPKQVQPNAPHPMQKKIEETTKLMETTNNNLQEMMEKLKNRRKKK
jgi:hypothetical protein